MSTIRVERVRVAHHQVDKEPTVSISRRVAGRRRFIDPTRISVSVAALVCGANIIFYQDRQEPWLWR